MAAPSLAQTYPLDISPGNQITLLGSNLFGGTSSGIVVQNQNVYPFTTSSTTIPATFDTVSGGFVTFTVPDGLLSGPLVVSTSAGSASLPVRVRSQYVQAAEYVNAGEGSDLSSMAPGELDAILRRASNYVNDYCLAGGSGNGDSFRLQQVIETDRWRQTRRYYPRRFPIKSIDSFIIEISQSQYATIMPTDVIINPDVGYVEVLSYAVTTYAIFGAIQNLGYSANIVQFTYTAGWGYASYPSAIREATILIATELITDRQWRLQGTASYETIKRAATAYAKRQERFGVIPERAKAMLQPYYRYRIG